MSLAFAMNQKYAYSNWILPLIACLLGTFISGCHVWQIQGDRRTASPYPAVSNPLLIDACDRQMAMDQVADEIDNYFSIRQQQNIQLVDNILTEGMIETHPRIGSGVFEPWAKDSSRGYEKYLATLQTIRRWARVRVIPDANGYIVDVKVYKEMEDRNPPDHSVVNGAIERHDNALDSYNDRSVSLNIQDDNQLKWFPLGRDFELEQKILRNLKARLCRDTL